MSTPRDKIDRLSDQKRALVSALLKERAGADRAPIQPRTTRDATAPLSSAQQRLWVQSRLEPENPFYNIVNAVALRGPLDVAALARAVAAIADRHDVLRTRFVERDGRAMQEVDPALHLALPLDDLTRCVDPRAEADARMAAAAREPFDLATSVVRARLFKLAAEHHVLFWAIHHIATDGWSMAILLGELSTLYAAFVRGEPSPLPPLAIQYRDVAAWEHEPAQVERVERQLTYWQTTLRGPHEPLDLPTDRVRPPARTFHGANAMRGFPAELNARIAELARASGATPYMVWLAAFQTVLHRYTGKIDLFVGTTVANRRRIETEALIGYFANTVVLRTSADGNPTFRALLARVKDTVLGAQGHEDVSFERVVQVMKPERDPSRHPLFQVMFVYQSGGPVDRFAMAGLHVEPIYIHNATAKFELDLSLVERATGTEASLVYNRDLFLPQTAARLLHHLETCLAAAVAAPDTRIGELEMLSAEERHRILVEWNRTEVDFPAHATLHGLFEAHAALAPDAPAVIFAGHTLTRGELDRRANQLAHHLRALGVGPNVPVGLSVARSFEMVIAMVAIAKAGGAYLPLDPSYPADRLAFMLGDAGAPVLLTQADLRARYAEFTGEIVCLDRDAAQLAARPVTPCASGVTAGDLAYVIYTSASTGRAKGVMVDHRGRVNNFLDFNRRYRVGAADRLLSVSSLSFDMTAYDVFGTLIAGAAIVLPTPDDERDPACWAALMAAHGVSVWHSAPAMLGLLVDYLESHPATARPAACRLTLLGGDWIPVGLPDRWKALATGAHVVSMGGATEVSMDSTIFDIERTEARWNSIPYGVPMANQLAYVLDPHGRPTPVGIPGELHLGGAGVGWGYRGRPALTAEKFTPNPFSGRPGDRMYRTGDLARFGADGVLELLGRIDFQTKLRGYRIELGEIEAALRAFAPVAAGLVVARQDPGHDKRLVAYLLLKPDGAPHDDQALRAHLAGRLPDYMIPSAFVVLDQFPLTPNGKIDRRALPAPAAGPQMPYVAPSTPEEVTIVEIWRQILGVERISVLDNFFALGGESTRAIKLVNRLRDAGLRVTPKVVFQHQTVRELARVVERIDPTASPAAPDGQAAGQIEALRHRHTDAEAVYGLGPMQAHMLAQLERRPIPGLYTIQHALSLPGSLDVGRFREAWRQLTARHPILRSSFVRDGDGGPLQVVHAAIELPLIKLDWRGVSFDEQRERLERLSLVQRDQGFDLARAPLVRLFVFRMTDESYLVLQFHFYGLLDGWSVAVLRRDVLRIYQALVTDQPVDLPPAPLYADFVTWTQAQDPAPARAYWRDTLAGFAGDRVMARLRATTPADSAGQVEDLAVAATRLSADELGALQAFAREHDLTPSSVIMGAWALVLARRAEPGEDVVFGVTTSGRSADVPGIEAMVGLFINSVPVRAPAVAAGGAVVAWLRDLQARRAEGSAHEHIPLFEIYAAAGLAPDQRAFDSVIVFDNYPIDEAVAAAAPALEAQAPFANEQLGIAQTEFPLRIDVRIRRQLGLTFSFYRSALDAAVVEALLGELAELLRQLPRRADATLGPLVAAG